MIRPRDLLALAVHTRDREAVLGDLSELQVSELRACGQILGLIGRRQLSFWLSWSAWLGLLALVVPTSLLLSYVSRWWADGTAIQTYLYLGNWTTSYLASPGARRDLLAVILSSSGQSLALIVWSAIFGYAMGIHYRRATLSAVLTALVVFTFGTIGTITTARLFGGNQHVFADPSYGFWLPAFFRIVLVAVPVVAASARGARRESADVGAALGCVTAAALLIALLSRQVIGALVFGADRLPGAGRDGLVGTLDDLEPATWLAWILLLPAIWLAGHALRRRGYRLVPHHDGDIS